MTAPTTILTVRMDARSQAFFERLRQEHYPAELNRIAAHLTLFHTLPALSEVRDVLAAAALREPFAVRVTGLRSLGRGVAYFMESRQLKDLQGELARAFADTLTAQDRQGFRPHVVVQNKTSGEAARELKARLQAGFQPFEVQALGLELWNYLGGPWELAERFDFAPGAP